MTALHTYNAGSAGWGIAIFINGRLIPELVLRRGKTYTFVIHGGDDPSETANYHPFYITNSKSGGRILNSDIEKSVSILDYFSRVLHYTPL